MFQFNFNVIQIFQFGQTLQPIFLYRWILVVVTLGYLIFHAIVLNQIHSMDKIITQPLSSTILSFVSAIFIFGGIILFLVLVFSKI